jgi:phosphatidylinositol glycan class S
MSMDGSPKDDAATPAASSRPAAEVANDELAPVKAFWAVKVKKQPPPETAHEIRTRQLIILSFWAIVLVFGIPIWWRTTTIYRAKLPLDRMMDWAEGRVGYCLAHLLPAHSNIQQACRPVFPLKISIDPGSLQPSEAQHLLRSTQHALDDLNDFSGHHLRLQLAPPTNITNSPHEFPTSATDTDEEVALLIRLLPGQTPDAVLQKYEPTLDIYYTPQQIPSSSSSSPTLATFIATQLRTLFTSEQDTISYLLSTSSNPPDPKSAKSLSPEVRSALAKRQTRSLKYSRTYHLTFSLFTPSAEPSSWEIQGALEEFMVPLLHSLGGISNFTIDTQVQLYATPGVTGPVLRKEDLSSFINAAEWPLSPGIGGAPTINFIVYIGDMEVEGGAKSWLIPQWGGVVIQPDVRDLEGAMLTFSHQLLLLLGAPVERTEGMTSLPLKLTTLSRVRSAELLLRASSTLGSLARLTLALPSISIPPSVAEGVQTTLEHLELACGRLGGKEGLEHARIAEEAAERAFFEKSMVGQVYFPDEHKVAVYLPLLGPVGVPLVMGVVKEVAGWRRRRRGGI